MSVIVTDMAFWDKDHVTHWSDLDDDDIMKLLQYGLAPMGGCPESSIPFTLVQRDGDGKYDSMWQLFENYCLHQRTNVWNKYQEEP